MERNKRRKDEFAVNTANPTVHSDQPKLLIPREHGAWAMLAVPFLLGVAISDLHWLHVPAGIGFLFSYMALYAILELKRQPRKRRDALYTFTRLGIVSVLLLVIPFFFKPYAFLPLAGMLPLLAVSLWFLRQKRERHFLNDVSGIVALSLLLPVAAELGGGVPFELLGMTWLLSFLYFLGTVFFVKSVFREKQNRPFHLLGIVYHWAVAVVPLLLPVSPWLCLAFVPGAVKMSAYRKIQKWKPIQIGIGEILHVTWFFLAMAIWM